MSDITDTNILNLKHCMRYGSNYYLLNYQSFNCDGIYTDMQAAEKGLIYTETKNFSNTLQIRIFITEIHVEITQTE